MVNPPVPDPQPVLIPPPPGVRAMLTGLTAWMGVVVIGMAVGSSLFWRWVTASGELLTVSGCGFLLIFVPIGIGLLVMAGHFWRLGREPLAVRPDGRVCYRDNELFAAAVGVVVRRVMATGESSVEFNYRVFARLADRETELPIPYFTGFETRKPADIVAAALGAALRVEVTQEE